MMKKSSVKSTLGLTNTGSRDSVVSQKFLEFQCNIKIPCFWGIEDYIEAADWIELYDRISSDFNWTSRNKMVRLGGYLKKHALVWYVNMVKLYPIENTSWFVYKDMFANRFSMTTISDRGSATSTRSDTSSQH